jgi:hypothetical protein
MNNYSIHLLKSFRKLYLKVFGVAVITAPECEQDPDKAAHIIHDALMTNNPCMIARFGANELECVVNYLGIKMNNHHIISYISGCSPEWWWSEKMMIRMRDVAGFFPEIPEKFEQFSMLMLKDIPEIDILGSWLPNERYFKNELKNVRKIWLLFLDPYWSKKPWTMALEGKKVLVVHPFAKTIEQQYKKRELLFKNRILPDFDLKTIKAVQSAAQEKTGFADWFEALEYMKKEIDKVDYDICLIGAGAYGFSLAAHVKRQGKKAFHIGGSLQLLFGIKGKRWENRNYHPDYIYADLMNEYWVYPDEDEKPVGANKVEGACYW